MMLSVSRVIAGVAVAVVAFLVKRATDSVYFPPSGSMNGKTVLITGGSTGLGLESAKRLAAAGAQTVIITARSQAKGEAAVEQIQKYLTDNNNNNNATTTSSSSSSSGSPRITYKILELDDLESIKAAASHEWDDVPAESIHVLMLNAGVMALPDLQLTKLGLERQFHTNHLGHFVFTASILDKLAPSARIIVVSSEAHQIPKLYGGLDLDYSWKPSADDYSPWKSYGMSKLANVYFAAALQRRVIVAESPKYNSWRVVSLHPGTVATDLARQLSSNRVIQKIVDDVIYPIGKKLGFLLSVEQGANTQVYLASTSDTLSPGAYYSGMAVQKLGAFATNATIREQLWKQSEAMAGMPFFNGR